MVAEIRAQYTLGYLSTNDKTDGAWRKVEIKVVRKDGGDHRVRARKGYLRALQRNRKSGHLVTWLIWSLLEQLTNQ